MSEKHAAVEQPIHRLIFRGRMYPDSDDDSTLGELVLEQSEDSALITLCLFRQSNDLFIYAESLDSSWTPSDVFARALPLLERWPGGEVPRTWVPMMDIFHYQRCVASELWHRREPPERRSGRLTRLRPEMVSSYIFYHYQLQEEETKDASSFGTIGIHENLLFFYTETPNFVEEPYYRRLLSTHNTPKNWTSVMEPHFLPWPDSSLPVWQECRLVAAV